MASRLIRAILFGSVVLALVVVALPAASVAQVAFSISFGPPALPIYTQPPCPADGYIWTPGYWAYDYDYNDYYWVPGTWVMAPQPGLFWTPGYWAWNGNGFLFNEGYWAPQVGFYGGIDYGYGYFGQGYQGGRWQNGRFFYNRSVNNINVTNIHNVYNTTIINRNSNSVNRVSYNGGNGGINARPRPEEQAVARERHIPPVAAQTQHVRAARTDPQLRASANQGKPPVAATPKPGDFKDRAVVAAERSGGTYNRPANAREGARPNGNGGNRPDENRPEANRPPANRPDSGASRNDRPANTRPNAERETSPRPDNPRPNNPRPDSPRPNNPRPDNPRPDRPSREAPRPDARPANPRPDNNPRPNAQRPDNPRPEAQRPENP